MRAKLVDPIDALQLELQRYPGIELWSIREEGHFTRQDEESGDWVVMDLLLQNLVMLIFKGPATGVSDQPTYIAVPVPAKAIHNPVFRSALADHVADDFERAIQDHAVE